VTRLESCSIFSRERPRCLRIEVPVLSADSLAYIADSMSCHSPSPTSSTTDSIQSGEVGQILRVSMRSIVHSFIHSLTHSLIGLFHCVFHSFMTTRMTPRWSSSDCFWQEFSIINTRLDVWLDETWASSHLRRGRMQQSVSPSVRQSVAIDIVNIVSSVSEVYTPTYTWVGMCVRLSRQLANRIRQNTASR